jgi:integrase/recombinase XerC
MHDPVFRRWRRGGVEGWMGRADLAGAARLQLVSGVVQLRPEDAMVEAM